MSLMKGSRADVLWYNPKEAGDETKILLNDKWIISSFDTRQLMSGHMYIVEACSLWKRRLKHRHDS